jgi:hypothetical protein
MNESMTDGALQLAAAGWRVFPVNAESKRPRTKHGHLDATTDEQTIVGWSNSFNVGGAIATPATGELLRRGWWRPTPWSSAPNRAAGIFTSR